MTKSEVNRILIALGTEWDDFLNFIKGQTFTEQDGKPYFFAQDVNKFIMARARINQITIEDARKATFLSDKLAEYEKHLERLTNCAHKDLCFRRVMDEIYQSELKDEVAEHLYKTLWSFIQSRIGELKADIQKTGVSL